MNNQDIAEKQTIEGKYFEGTGRRKRAVARVRLYEGKKGYIKNFVKQDILDDSLQVPFETIGYKDKFGISVVVKGSGIKSQQGAIIHGIARALISFDETLKSTLRKAGFVTRDPREKERKKPGLRRARRAPQWQKR
jgi:small subunit ribosomal protein S9